MALLAISSCSEDSKSKNEPANGGGGNPDAGTNPAGTLKIDNPAIKNYDYNLDGLSLAKVEPPVAETTPGALAIPSSLHLAKTNLTTGYDFSLSCEQDATSCAADGTNDPDGSKQKLCTFLQDIKCRYLGVETGPTSIVKILKNIDENTAGFETLSKGAYVGCMDPENKPGFGPDIADAMIEAGKPAEDGSVKDLQDLAGFSQGTFNPSYTLKTYDFTNTEVSATDYTFEFPFEIKANCQSTYDEAKRAYRSWAIIEDEVQGETYTHLLEATNNGFAAIVKSKEGQKDEVDIFGTVGESTFNDYNVTSGTNIIYRLKANPNTGIMEMTATGVGTGSGCGMHFKSNGTYLFAWWDDGYLGKSPDDGLVSNSCDVSSPLTACIKVDGNAPEATDMTACEGVSLTIDDFTMPTYTQYANTLHSKEFGGFEAYNASDIFTGDEFDPKDIGLFKAIELPDFE